MKISFNTSLTRFGQHRSVLLRADAADQPARVAVAQALTDVFMSRTAPASPQTPLDTFRISFAPTGQKPGETVFQVMDEPGDKELPVEEARAAAISDGIIARVEPDSYRIVAKYDPEDPAMDDLFDTIEERLGTLYDRTGCSESSDGIVEWQGQRK